MSWTEKEHSDVDAMAKACAAHHTWKAVSAQVQAFFLQTTLADLVQQEQVEAKKRGKKVARR